MRALPPICRHAVWLLVAATAMFSGCLRHHRTIQELYQSPPPAAPLGTHSDPMWKTQETNAETSDFVVYQHEFEYNGVRLNMAGEDHVKQIAWRLLQTANNLPVLVERSVTSVREDSQYKYPVNPNPELDVQRREVVVRSLAAMGVPDADQRVVVAPALAAGEKASEATAAYQRSFLLNSTGGNGWGASMGGGSFGPFGGIGGIR